MTRDSANPFLLWLGILAGPVAFGLTRLAGIVLLNGPCPHPGGTSVFLGLSTAQWLMVLITGVCALIAGMAAVLCWHLWRQSGRQEEEQISAGTGNVPFFSLGGLFVSGVFFLAIVLTGGLALGLSTDCVS